MPKREFVHLAQKYVPEKHGGAGDFYSIKLDGERCFWDSGITRGMDKADVPWANLAKDARYKVRQIATGLWSRYGNVIHAPDWWLDRLPCHFLDGELYGGLQSFQSVSSIVSKLPNTRISEDWHKVTYYLYGMPPPEEIFAVGEITGVNYNKKFTRSFLPWVMERFKGVMPAAKAFQNVYTFMKHRIAESDTLKVHDQEQLPFNTDAAIAKILEELDRETEKGGEGIIIRRRSSLWKPERNYDLLKVKKFKDDEAIVIGYTCGSETDKGSKLLGLMGALILDYNGLRFKLSGFTDQERQLNDEKARVWATQNPDAECPEWIYNPMFPRGSTITFKYRDLTDDGIPKEARYWRKRHG